MASQTVHRATIGNPFVNMQYWNDTEDSFPWAKHMPLLPKLSEESIGETDRLRTAGGRLRVGLFELKYQLHTGQGERQIGRDTDNDGVIDTWEMTGGTVEDSKRSNGIITIGFGPINLGWDSEGIRHALQNKFAHDWLNGGQNGSAYPWFPKTDRKGRFVFQFNWF